MDDNIFFGNTGISFTLWIILRTFLMFIIILFFLRLLGKRGVKQLSIFELVVILGLGSAAGDPMIYKEVGIVNALVAFVVIVICYKLLTVLVFKYKWIENIVEGKEVYIVKKGKFAIEEFEKESVSKDEFFMELRLKGVFHLGQVEYAVLELSGELSVYFFPKKQTRYVLPILPDSLKKTVHVFETDKFYACTFCGQTVKYQNTTFPLICPQCNKKE